MRGMRGQIATRTSEVKRKYTKYRTCPPDLDEGRGNKVT